MDQQMAEKPVHHATFVYTCVRFDDIINAYEPRLLIITKCQLTIFLISK